MTTPDPITTARQSALELRQIACLLNDDQAQVSANFDREAAITAALDYAEKLNGDLAASERSLSQWQRLASENKELVMSGRAEITRLTSQLEQAERVIKPFADENEAQVEERPSSVKDSARPYMFYRATYADLSALSQWIKDRQAKTDATLTKGIKE